MSYLKTKPIRTPWSVAAKPYLQLTRPANVLIGMMSIAMGALVAGSLSPWQNVLFASLSGGLIAAAANTINDYYDIAIDRINKPHRPLPAGKISLLRARNWALLLFAAGIGTGLLVHWIAFFIALASALLLYLYSFHFKRTVLWGNLIVSFVSGLAFIYGGVAVFRLRVAVIPAGFAFCYHLGREILKDIEDVTGDRLENAHTLPVRHGINPARWLISCIFSLLIFLTVLPYVYNIFGSVYLVIVVLGVDLFLFYVIFSLWRDASPQNLHRLSEWLKLDMLVGLLAIFAGVRLG